MMTINVIDCVTWLVCNLQTGDRFLNMLSKMKMTSSINFFCQGDILSKVSKLYQVSNLCGFDLKMCLRRLCSLGRFRNYKQILFIGRMYTPTLCTQKVKAIIIHLRKTVQMFIYMLTWHFEKQKQKFNTTNHCWHSPIHSPYLLPGVSVP